MAIRSAEAPDARIARRVSAVAVIVLIVLLLCGVVGLAWQRWKGIANLMVRAATTQWVVVNNSAAGSKTYPDFATEWNTSPNRIRAGLGVYSITNFQYVTEMEGVFHAYAGDPNMVIVVFRPSAATLPAVSSRIGMIVEVQALTESTGGVVLPQAGSVTVRSELTPEQASKVMTSGLPVCLVDALVQRAQAAGWTPPPSPVTGGVAPPMIQVDPAPCLDAAGP